MAQKSRQRQPVYSADTLALRYMGGLALAALGVVMFLAVDLRMAGNVFDVLRQVCFGLTGGLASVLPILPVWAGALVIWSSQRKAPVRPFLYASLGFLCLCAAIVMMTRLGSEEYLSALSHLSDGSWGGVIQQGYLQSISRKASGGALGVALAFPFWSLVGTILGAFLLCVLLLLCVALALNLTPAKIRDLAAGRIPWRRERSAQEQAGQDARQIAWQQGEELRRQQQEAFLRQQQMAEAQAQAAARQASGRWTQSQPAWPQQSAAPGSAPSQASPAGWPETQAAGRGQTGSFSQAEQAREDIRDWQQQLTRQALDAQSSGRRSVIFDRPAETEPVSGGGRGSQIFGTAAESARDKGSVGFFGRRKQEKSDGLSDLSEEEKRREGMAYPPSGRTRPDKPTKASRIREEQARIEEDLDAWRRPEKERAPESRESGRQNTKGAAESPWQRQVAEAAEKAGRKPAGTPRSAAQETAWESRPEISRTEAESRAETGRTEPESRAEVRRSDPETRRPESRAQTDEGRSRPESRAEQVAIPVVQETIKDPTWKPELKNVAPKEEEPEEEFWQPTPYCAPPITDLKKPDISVIDTRQEDEIRSQRLTETLASFRVQARVVHVTHGPSISRFELELAPGTKVGKVSELEKDIAYGMQATSVRIEAPIPGKSLVGVEVPNPKRATVTLREVLESPAMQNAKSILTVALGKDIAGTPIVCDLAKMPHMLIAGATGSGKSVCINTIINSLLFRAGPDEVKMILVDPKVVELQCYNGIPHLLLPVVNDPHKAAAALAWAVAEMMERYDKFSERGVRNLEGYNAILEEGEKPMPRIVIIIDELADLMMVCKKDVEEYICRLTQLARAAGIHLIVATQRPSVDVITGLIKANIPSRIAFKTASYVDSRTILDRNGSEQLLGWGDMLYLPTGSFAPTRIQGCFLSDEEVNRIADHVRQANPSSYDPNVLDKLEQLTRGQEEGPGMDMVGGAQENSDVDASLFEQAVEFAIADGQISTSTLQRRLKVGYARAGRLTDEMEERGIVSAKDGSKPRKCLITREEWERMKESTRAAEE